jgi:hypothetical protein
MSTVKQLLFRKRQELRELQKESSSAEKVLETLQNCLNVFTSFPKVGKTSKSYIEYKERLEILVSDAFDNWASYDDEVEKVQDQISRIQKFRDT